AAGKRRVDPFAGGEPAHPDRGPVPEAIVDRELPAGREIERGNGDPRDPSFGKARWKVVSAAGVGDGDFYWDFGAGGCMRGAGDGEIEYVAQAIPDQPRLLRRRAALTGVHPVDVVIDTLLVGKQKAEHGELRVQLNTTGIIQTATNQ